MKKKLKNAILILLMYTAGYNLLCGITDLVLGCFLIGIIKTFICSAYLSILFYANQKWFTEVFEYLFYESESN